MAPSRRVHPISVCVITLDEERNIRACLESARWAEEIVVVDSRSTDRTVAIAREFTDRVLLRDFEGHVEQKNFCLDQATHDWALCLDADERITPELREAIEEALSVERPVADGFTMPRRTYYLGRWIRRGGWYPDRKLRLFRRDRGRWGGENPHDRVELAGAAAPLDGEIRHYSYRDLGHHLGVINLFSGIAARAKRERGVRHPVLRMVVDPPAKFVKAYLLRGGFLDGRAGLVIALMGAYSVFLKYAKLWELQRRAAEGDA